MSMKNTRRAAAGLIGIGLVCGSGFAQVPQGAPKPATPKAQAPPKAARQAPRPEGAASLQAEVEVRYLRLQSLMAKLLEAIDKARETGRVAAALERSEELKVVDRLRAIQGLLGSKDFGSALEEEKAVEKDLERILRILKGLDEAEEAKRAREDLESLKDDLERLGKLALEEEKHLEETRRMDGESRSPDDPKAKEESSDLARKQRDTQGKTDELRKSVERSDEGREESREGQEGEESKEGAEGEEGEEGQEGEGKEGQGKSGQGKQGKGKQGQGKQGQGKQGKQSEGQQSEGQESEGQPQGKQVEGKEQAKAKTQKDARQARPTARQQAARALRRAAERMRGASQRIEAQNLKGAEEDEEEALAELERAAEELEEEIAQQEEENQEELARKLIHRLEAMLAEQEVVSLETKHADNRAKGTEAASSPAETPGAETPGGEAKPGASPADAPPDDAEPQSPKSLARRERSLMTDAEDALRVLEADDTSVSAPSIIERVRDDLGNAASLLDGGETGEVTQLLQADIERTLRELIEALTPPERPPGPPGEPPPPGRPPRPRDLVTPVMEIKMMLSTQRRLRQRTEKLEELGLLQPRPAGDAPDAAAGAAPKEPPPAKAPDPQPGESPEAEAPLEAQARRLAEAQAKLAGLMEALVAKYPVIDALLLGAENELQETRDPLEIPLLPPVEGGETERPPPERQRDEPAEKDGRGSKSETSPGDAPGEKGDRDESSK